MVYHDAAKNNPLFLSPSGASLFAALLQRDTIKTITLTQPWATLVALGKKRIETRSWPTTYRGPLAIHAAKGFPEQAQELCRQEPFWSALKTIASDDYYGDPYDLRWPLHQQLPRGHIIAVGLLEEVQRIFSNFPVEEPERSFGNYTKGRYAWTFSTIYQLERPVPARGSLGLWNWQPPESFWREVQFQLEKERAAQ